MENLKKFVKCNFKDEKELVMKILEKVEDGKNYRKLPLFSMEIERDSKFYETYSNRFPLFVVASIKVKDKYLVIKKQE